MVAPSHAAAPACAAAAAAGAGLQQSITVASSSSGSCCTANNNSPGAIKPSGSSSTGTSSSKGDGGWHARLAGWCGGNAGLPVDGWLTTCCSQIGQIMLVLPNAFAKCGMAAALPLSLGCACVSFWTMWCLIALYAERKHRLIKSGRWAGPGGKSQHVTQYHDVMADNLGRHVGRLVQAVVVVSLFGTNVSQIVASSSDAYYLGQGHSKRDLALIFGGLMQLSVLLPTLRHFRVINILGLLGTTYTAWFIVTSAAQHGVSAAALGRGPASMRDFFTGFSVIMSAFGGHAMSLEIMDSMFQPERYTSTYAFSALYIFSLTLPHSTAVQLAWPEQALTNSNVYGILPLSTAKSVSIYMMLAHQIIAFCLYSAPLYIMAERLLRVHDKPLPVRILARLPVSLGVAAFAVALPFYGTLNSVVGAITSPLIAFALPAGAYSWMHRTREAQAASVRPPPPWMMRALGWTGVHVLNAFIVVFFLVAGTGFGIAFSVAQLVRDVQHFSIFPACFQC